MPTTHSPRLSIPVGGRGTSFTEEEFHRYSFDIGLFPRYLERAAPRVHILISERKLEQQFPSLQGLYAHEGGAETCKVAFLQPDAEGVVTDSDDFYDAAHAAFAAQAGDAQYLGFTRNGKPPYAPLFALAMVYRKFGRGLYQAGELLPTPWPSLSFGYALRTG